ncbi:MAG: hypothetical protein FJ304_13400 [Planctomycetes bacterium]|nr:hypothetical protein [Planctomycetota bacterium]
MKRHLCVTALLALALVPDWASACWPRRGGAFYTRAHYAPVVYRPAPAYCQPVYVYPVVPAPKAPPQIEPIPKGKAGSAVTDPPRPMVAKPTPAPADPDPVRPVVNTETPKPAPAPEPRPKKPEPAIELPKPGGSDNLPPFKLPTPDGPALPPLELPKVGVDPKLPPLELPGKGKEPGAPAIPIPAPAPDLIPAPAIPVPKDNTLPPLTLPPEAPVLPPLPKVVEAKASPFAGAARALKVDVFPAAGSTATANGHRKIGFFNHTGRDLALVIEGQKVTLPARSYLHATLPPTFTWKCGDEPAATARVPADAAGLDVLIRE